MVVGQLVAITVIIGPMIVGLFGLMQLSHAPSWVRMSMFAIIALAELAWVIARLRRTHRLAGNLTAHEDVIRGWGFVIWQCQRDMHLLYPIRTLESVTIVRRYRLAARLDTYLRMTSHQRLWERLLRLIPREFVVYVVVYACMTKVFDLARLAYIRRTLDFDRARWMIHTIARVNSIYAR
jgi:hypothetical protein